MTSSQQDVTPKEQLSHLFGSFKAEWLKGRVFELFTEPAYFSALTAPRPCMLIGGRGTGKTTVLRCMSYEGQFVLRNQDASNIPSWPYYGLYCRINTNRVTAFKGPELPEQRWIKVFAHYLNLVMCELVLDFLAWYRRHCPDSQTIAAADCASVATGLHLTPASTTEELARRLAHAKEKFQAYINNVADHKAIPLSMQGAPVDVLCRALLRLPEFANKHIFFLLDEYENFEDYQQQVVNTLIKHAEFYTFKVGVRELGLRCRSTLNANEQLIHPADYVRINIAEELKDNRFTAFALEVCGERISKLKVPKGVVLSVKKLLPSISEEDEAEILDADGHHHARDAAQILSNSVPKKDADLLADLRLLEKYFLVSWARSQDLPIEKVWRDFADNRATWEGRYDNYKHSLLYTLRRKKRGIQKYYAGWNVFTQLAAGNIRYFLELVDQSLLIHLEKHSMAKPVAYSTQTLAAQAVGRKNLAELEGLTVHGAQLTKLLLGLGRVFQTMAFEALGHAPEVNQFHLMDEKADSVDSSSCTNSPEVGRLISAAVMHLALLRSIGSKLADEGDTRDYDYMVHPIFAPFFVFSYRKKRKMMLTGGQLLGLVSSPKRTIRAILACQGRQEKELLPEQLLLFEAYYNADS